MMNGYKRDKRTGALIATNSPDLLEYRMKLKNEIEMKNKIRDQENQINNLKEKLTQIEMLISDLIKKENK